MLIKKKKAVSKLPPVPAWDNTGVCYIAKSNRLMSMPMSMRTFIKVKSLPMNASCMCMAAMCNRPISFMYMYFRWHIVYITATLHDTFNVLRKRIT